MILHLPKQENSWFLEHPYHTASAILKPNALHLWMFLWTYSKPDEPTIIYNFTNKYIADQLSTSPATVSKMLKELTETGFIQPQTNCPEAANAFIFCPRGKTDGRD